MFSSFFLFSVFAVVSLGYEACTNLGIPIGGCCVTSSAKTIACSSLFHPPSNRFISHEEYLTNFDSSWRPDAESSSPLWGVSSDVVVKGNLTAPSGQAASYELPTRTTISNLFEAPVVITVLGEPQKVKFYLSRYDYTPLRGPGPDIISIKLTVYDWDDSTNKFYEGAISVAGMPITFDPSRDCVTFPGKFADCGKVCARSLSNGRSSIADSDFLIGLLAYDGALASVNLKDSPRDGFIYKESVPADPGSHCNQLRYGDVMVDLEQCAVQVNPKTSAWEIHCKETKFSWPYELMGAISVPLRPFKP